MDKIVEVIHALPRMLSLKAATTEQITEAENQLQLVFSEEYKEYLSAFGAILADGVELSGIAKSAHRNVVALTKQSWELNPKVPHDMYVVENTGMDGVLLWQDASGKVYRSTPNAEPQKVASSLKDYLQARFGSVPNSV